MSVYFKDVQLLNRTCAQTPATPSLGGSSRVGERYCRGKQKDSRPLANTYSGTQKHTLKGYMPNLAGERQAERLHRGRGRKRDWGERKRQQMKNEATLQTGLRRHNTLPT